MISKSVGLQNFNIFKKQNKLLVNCKRFQLYYFFSLLGFCRCCSKWHDILQNYCRSFTWNKIINTSTCIYFCVINGKTSIFKSKSMSLAVVTQLFNILFHIYNNLDLSLHWFSDFMIAYIVKVIQKQNNIIKNILESRFEIVIK